MNEKKLKIVTTVVKIAGGIASVAAMLGGLPEKYQWIGLMAIGLASAAKDGAMWLGDLWDDGVINKSFKG